MKECVPKGDNDGRSGRFCRYSTHILPIRDSFHSEKSIIISSNEWRNRNESISYRKIHFLKEKTEKHGVSNKTISKWETGKCMPDYSIIKNLCDELEITVAELFDGETSGEKSVRVYDKEQFLNLLRRIQELEKQKNTLYGVVLIVMGIAMQALSYAVGGSDMKDFISGVLLGMSIAVMLIGVYVVGKSLSGK